MFACFKPKAKPELQTPPAASQKTQKAPLEKAKPAAAEIVEYEPEPDFPIENMTTYAEISQESAFFGLSTRSINVAKHYGEVLKKEMASEGDFGVVSRKAEMKSQCFNLPFFLTKPEEVGKIVSSKGQYFNNLAEYFEIFKIVEWLKDLDAKNEMNSIFCYKDNVGIYTKIFLRGKDMNDICRATAILDPSLFIKKIEAFCKEKGFAYWVECETNATGYKVNQVYVYHATKNYEGKILPFEIQVQTLKHFQFLECSGTHDKYEVLRLAQFAKSQKMFEEHNVSMDDVIYQLIGAGAIEEKEYESLKSSGNFEAANPTNFQATQTTFSIKGEIPLHFIDAQHANALKVINNNLFLTGSGYCWSNETFKITENYRLEVNAVIQGNIHLGIGPNMEYYTGNNVCWTVMVGTQLVWLRDQMFAREIKATKAIPINAGEANTIVVEVINKKITVFVNECEVKTDYTYPHPYFRVGIISWNEEPGTYIRSLNLKKL